MQNSLVPLIFSVFPIVCLTVMSLIINIRTAAIITFLLTVAAFLYLGKPAIAVPAVMIASLGSTLNILMIVSGAIFLYETMKEAGLIEQLNASIRSVSTEKDIIFFLITIGLTGFFEGIAGFGTPGAIVPLLLISLGYDAITSVAVVLIFDGVFASFGAVGTPINAGIIDNLGYPIENGIKIGNLSAIFLAITGLAFLLFSFRQYQLAHEKIKNYGTIILLYLLFAIPFMVLSPIVFELNSIISSSVMLFLSAIILNRGKLNMDMKPWLPYGFLIILLLLPKLINPLKELLSFQVTWSNIFSTDLGLTLTLLRSPFFPFVFTALLVIMVKKPKVQLSGIIKKMGAVLLVLYPVICIAQMMVAKEGSFSMIDNIALLTKSLGGWYPIASPFIGMTGAFITGSTTVSNLVLAATQDLTATQLSMDNIAILALQHSGAAIGNAICLFNIIAACSVAGIQKNNQVLKKTLIPTLAGGAILAAAGYLYLNFLS